MKKILLISHSSNYGGAEGILIKILEALNKENEVIIVIPNKKGLLSEKVNNNNIVFKKINNLTDNCFFKNIFRIILNLKTAISLLQLVKRNDIDIIYSNTSVNMVGIFLSIITRKQHIWHVHEIPKFNKTIFKLYEYLFQYKNGKIVFVSKLLLGNWEDSVKINMKKCSIVYNPIVKYTLNKRINNNFTFGFAGRLNRNKNICFLIKVFESIKQRYSNIKLIVAGEGELEDYLKKENSDGIEILGQVNNMSDFYSEIDVLIVPSINESFSLVAAEAMMVGKPVIVNENIGIKEIIEDRENGLIYKSNDEKNLYDKMEKIYMDVNLYKKISANGKKTMELYFSENRFLEEINNIIKK